ncbi:unnamed protein product [Caenorhabditis auriculariae]|uniref:Uncharacterized protein n=1 Tax=Caenorhabditis auriculariae TaxID=2777116 RepID=A0A8S1H0E0_9PELO|nr:unnamed protein product [Caenorhabditis auriculariae]
MPWLGLSLTRAIRDPLVSLICHPAAKNYATFVIISYMVLGAYINSIAPFKSVDPLNIKPFVTIFVFTSLMFYLPLFPMGELIELGLTVNCLFESLYTKRGNLLEYQKQKIVVHRLAVLSFFPFLFFNFHAYVHDSTKTYPTMFLYFFEASIWLLTCIFLLGEDFLEKGIGKKPIKFIEDFNLPTDIILQSLMREIEEHTAFQFVLSKSSNHTMYVTDNGFLVFLSNWDFSLSRIELCTAIVEDASALMIRRSQQANEIVRVKFAFVDGINTPITVSMENSKFEELRMQNLFTIRLERGVRFRRSVVEIFVIMFTRIAKENSKYTQVDYKTKCNDFCFACSIRRPNVKFVRSCNENERRVALSRMEQFTEGRFVPCGECRCLPMWCISCIARVFHAKLDTIQTWECQSVPCPTCREHFCIDDVHLLTRDPGDESEEDDNEDIEYHS